MILIQKYEHDSLFKGENNFSDKHWKALLKLNEVHQGKYFDVLHNGIKLNHYVGVIQVANLIIEIHPKADRDGENSQWKGVLLQMLQACGRLSPSTSGAARVSRQNLNLLEVYFELFLNEVQGLLRKGLIKKYRSRTQNMNALKGKLEFAGNIQRNLVHKERFYTTHQVYDTNHFLHHVLWEALEVIEQFTKGTNLYDHCRRVMLDFPEVSQKRITAQQLESIVLDRKSRPYAEAIKIARLILLNYSPDISGGREQMISLLFNMNELWEEYVLVQLRRHSETLEEPYKIEGQDTKTFWGSNYLKPDIVIEKGDHTYIIDTKWKVPSSPSASIADLRQMYAYNRFWDAKKVMLLYPGANKNTSYKSFETDEYHPNNEMDPFQHQCKLGFVDVVDASGKLVSIAEDIFQQLQFE